MSWRSKKHARKRERHSIGRKAVRSYINVSFSSSIGKRDDGTIACLPGSIHETFLCVPSLKRISPRPHNTSDLFTYFLRFLVVVPSMHSSTRFQRRWRVHAPQFPTAWRQESKKAVFFPWYSVRTIESIGKAGRIGHIECVLERHTYHFEYSMTI